jgi:hypothetical protein
MNKIPTSDFTIAYLTLISGLSISAVAVYYSVIGLVSIFSASVIPIMIMGIALEVSKLIVTVWLKRHWKDASILILSYLTSAVIVLMFITSLGIYGFLSKAHSDQALPNSNIVDAVSLIDEKIKTQRDNIDISRKALLQMDASVDQIMARTTNEKGATRSVQIRRSQAKERTMLQTDINNAQSAISKLNDERTPFAKNLRIAEAEVGPIKSVAALIYGDTVDSSMLERSVRWMIVLIVSVFDPLAIMLLLACQHSFAEISKKKIINETVPLISEILPEVVIEEVTPVIDNIEILPDINLLVNNAEDSSHSSQEVEINGDAFPKNPVKGQQFIRTNYDPARTFIFDGIQWINL